jgi:carboxybiotin decarboxylase
MALVPIIQPPIMRALTTKAGAQVVMEQLRPVSRLERILFPFAVLLSSAPCCCPRRPADRHADLGQPAARERGGGAPEPRGPERDHQRRHHPAGAGIGSKLSGELFLTLETLGILVLGRRGLQHRHRGGVLMGKLMHRLTGGKVNPLIGAAGVSRRCPWRRGS